MSYNKKKSLGKGRCFLQARRVLSLIVLLLLSISVIPAMAQGITEPPEPTYIRGVVQRVHEPVKQTAGDGIVLKDQIVEVKISKGPYAGQVLRISHARLDNPAYDIDVKRGMEVILWTITDATGIIEAHIESVARDRSIAWLAGGYIGLLILVGGKKGLRSAVTLVITVLLIMRVLIPLLLKGYDPVMLAIALSAIISTVTIMIVGGRGRKSLSSIIGTTGGVMVAGMIARLVGLAAQLTGFGSEEASMLLYIPQEVKFDFRGLLFAGILIGALGAVMDVAVSVASAMAEVKRQSPDISPSALFASGMNVGRDVMGTMSNTLILAYTGGAIPLLLLFMAYNTPFIRIINLDLIATEVVRALAGSVGLIMAIPITALTSSYLLTAEDQ